MQQQLGTFLSLQERIGQLRQFEKLMDAGVLDICDMCILSQLILAIILGPVIISLVFR